MSDGIDVVPTESKGSEDPAVPQDAGGQGLLHFFEREALHDCVVRISTPSEKDFKCHKVVLCATSRFFYEQIIVTPSGAADIIELPALPDDAEVQRLVDVALIFPLILRFAYGNQNWESFQRYVDNANALGLFVLAEILGIPALVEKMFDYIGTSLLNGAMAIRLLYAVTRLGEDKVAEFSEIQERCIEALQEDFALVCSNSEDLRLLGCLPIDMLVELLDADELCVSSEGLVLHTVRGILEGQFGSTLADTVVAISDMRLCKTTAVLPKFVEQAEHGVTWELQLGSQIVTSSPLPLKPDAQGEYFIEKEFQLKTAAPGPTSNVQVTIRASAAVSADPAVSMDRNVLFTGVFPLLQVLPSGSEASLSSSMKTAGGDEVGVMTFKWRTSPLEETQPKEDEKKEDDTGEEQFSADEANRLLHVVRFAHLAHDELLRAAGEPLLIAAGGQNEVLQALSLKLQPHEPSESAFQNRPPRPSTLEGYRPHSAAPQQTQNLLLASSQTRQPLTLNAPVAGVEASQAQPVVFQRNSCVGEAGFDDGGVLYWLGTLGRTRVWRNPMGLGQVLALTSGVGFGMLEDLVGRSIVNLRTRNMPQSYFGVDLLGDRLLILEGYCLRNRSSTSHALTQWACQGSVDGKAWDCLDERIGQTSLRRAGAAAYFDIQSSARVPYRCFRIVQVGLNSSGSDNLALSGLELYGSAVAGKWP